MTPRVSRAPPRSHGNQDGFLYRARRVWPTGAAPIDVVGETDNDAFAQFRHVESRPAPVTRSPRPAHERSLFERNAYICGQKVTFVQRRALHVTALRMPTPSAAASPATG
jgi:hypothetical protein